MSHKPFAKTQFDALEALARLCDNPSGSRHLG
jgi:hypothetical protein